MPNNIHDPHRTVTQHGVSPQERRGSIWGKDCIQQVVPLLYSIVLVVLQHARVYMGLQHTVKT